MAADDEMKWDDFSDQLQYRCLGLEVQDRMYWVSREELSAFSPVFRAMLYGDFEESKKDIIQLPGKRKEEILEVLRCLFRTDIHLKQVDKENVEILLQFADEYQIKYLTEHCKIFLAKQVEISKTAQGEPGVHAVLNLFLIGLKYRFTNIVRATLPSVARFQASYDLKEELSHLPMGVKYALLSQRANQTVEDEYAATTSTCVVCHAERSRIQRCKFCNFVLCIKCKSGDLAARSGFALYCVICHACNKPAVFHSWRKDCTNQCGYCQCITDQVYAELEKLRFK